jgi:oligopeptide transport system ATP-binding protein
VSEAPILAAEGAAVRFAVRGSKKQVMAVDGVDLALHADETVALVGESGSGKTTLGLALLGLRSLAGGRVAWRGRDVASLDRDALRRFRRDAQIVFQDPYASLNPRLTIAETLRRPLALHRIVPADAQRDESARLLDRVGLQPGALYLDRYPHEFSGGQRQRIAIARALSLRPGLLVADEPVSALDVSIRSQVLNLLTELRQALGLSMLFLSHDLGVVRFIASRVAVMYLGRLVETGPTRALFETPRHPYTRALLAAAPSLSRAVAGPPLAGEPPVPSDPPSGCRFRTRCPFAKPRCAEETPDLRDAAAGHRVACHFDL